MTFADYIVIAVIAVCVIFALRKIITDIKNKKYGCCQGDCSYCKNNKKCDENK